MASSQPLAPLPTLHRQLSLENFAFISMLFWLGILDGSLMEGGHLNWTIFKNKYIQTKFSLLSFVLIDYDQIIIPSCNVVFPKKSWNVLDLFCLKVIFEYVRHQEYYSANNSRLYH
jgi:hypothetical protein